MLYRVDNDIIFEEIKTLERYSSGCATVLEKNNNYWVYHKNVLEDYDEEVINPADKIWRIAKYINNHKNFTLRGYRIKIGDTLKFGRVRFKVIKMENEVDGFQEFIIKKTTKTVRSQKIIHELTESDNEDNNNLNPRIDPVQ